MKLRYIKRAFEEISIFISGSILSFKNAHNRKLLSKNNSLSSKHENQRVFVFLTGTSINNIELEKFSNENIFGVNLIAYHRNFHDLKADYYAIPAPCDPRIARLFDFHLKIISNKIEKNCKLFLHGSIKSWIDESDYFDQESIFYTLSNEFVKDSAISPYCGVDESFKGSFTFAIGACIEMGFSEIYLVGADYSKLPLVVGHFYDGEKNTNPYDQNIVDKLHENHRVIRKFCENHNVKLFNVIEDEFSSPVFESVRLDEVYKMIDKASV